MPGASATLIGAVIEDVRLWIFAPDFIVETIAI